ncbi:M28 family peptidase [Terriglobus saanensis]|uniref:Peptidase M28 n=1 Tax=Terriglobus saanensis (strain ATCC BAA-1853 / DSM 23119 / SP1PR4) TaxID=401053 RepID=E8UZ49_TERSS|nr:M28 family peptidase [Terriglobus saanensis]ADV80994.1 peptidase M28 [Terriglobus saanensis SP1PR4]
MKILALLSSVALPLAAAAQMVPPAVKAAEQSIDTEKIRAHVRFLADDLLEGRGPGLRGSEIAAQYIATQFALDGLEPAGDNGTYLQQVKFVGVKADPEHTNYTLEPTKGKAIKLTFGEDYTASNQQHNPTADFDAPIVWVGYGARAPEFQWDDYAGLDVKGKVILCIVGDPPSDDPKFFGGKAMTYYGRWTYKFEEAARMGAIGALIIHRTDLASYGWDVVKNSNTGEKTYLADDANPKLAGASWIQLEVARKIFAASGMTLEDAFAAAGKRGFQGMELPIKLKGHVESSIRPFLSPNVIAKLPGTNAPGKDQAVLYSAHYDHLGFKPGMAGDNIYNGAVDNGVGVGLLLELARAWSTLKVKPAHSVYFASVTAEEQGLLGSEYLGQHPPVPAAQIALDINFDGIFPIGVPEEVNVNGAQRMTFYPTVQATAKRLGLAIVPDPRPEAGTYYRSDHFSLSREGIPAFSVDPGSKYEGHDAAWGDAQEHDYNEHRYHNFSDNYTPEMDFRAPAKLARFGMELGWLAISAPHTIEWNHGDEFEATRKKSER